MNPTALLPPSSSEILVMPTQTKPERWDAFSSRPGYGITPERVYRIFRAAEMGFANDQCQLYEDLLENDGHAQGQVNSRIESVAGKEWIVSSPHTDDVSKRVAAVLSTALKKTNFVDALEHHLSSFFFGYSYSEPVWGFVDGWWVPVWFENTPHVRFNFDDYARPLLSTAANARGDALSPMWWRTHARGRIPTRAGVGRCVSWWSVFKRLSVKDWLVFAEKFGIPIVLGIYKNGAGDDTRRALVRAVQDIGEGGQAVFNDAAQIVVSNHAARSGDTGALHPSVVKLCNDEISKVITGATLMTETGGPGSFALGKVHEGRALALQVSDARRVQTAFNGSVAAMFHALNGLPSTVATPELRIQVLPEQDPLTRAKLASILANELGMELDADQCHAEFGFRRPSSPENTLRGTKNAAPDQPDPAADPVDPVDPVDPADPAGA